MIAGLDPGKSGALALIDEAGAEVDPWLFDMPYLGDIPDVRWLDEQLHMAYRDGGAEWELPVLVVIEQPIAMPGQSSQSTATTFRSFGALLAWVTLAKVPLITPRPNAWKARLGVTKDKGSAVALAARLFPSAGLYGPRGGMKDGRAEALLLAEYGRRHHLGLLGGKK